MIIVIRNENFPFQCDFVTIMIMTPCEPGFPDYDLIKHFMLHQFTVINYVINYVKTYDLISSFTTSK